MPTSTEAKTLRKQLALDGADPFQLLATVLERNAQLTEQVRILTAIANRKGALRPLSPLPFGAASVVKLPDVDNRSRRGGVSQAPSANNDKRRRY